MDEKYDMNCKKYALIVANRDGVKDLAVQYWIYGSDELFFAYQTFKDGQIVQGETLNGSYLTDDCWLAANGEGFVVISDYYDKLSDGCRFKYGNRKPAQHA